MVIIIYLPLTISQNDANDKVASLQLIDNLNMYK